MSSVLMLVGSLRSGGAEGQIVLLANEFAAAGLDVCLAVLDGSDPAAFVPSKQVDLVLLGQGGAKGLCKALWRLQRLARRYAVLVGFLDLPNAILCMLKRDGQRVVCNVRSAGISPGWIARLSFQLGLSLTRNADKLVANAVATDVGGPAELVGTSGLLVPPNDVSGLSRALKRLVGDRELRMALGRDALARVHEHYKKELSVQAHLAAVRGG